MTDETKAGQDESMVPAEAPAAEDREKTVRKRLRRFELQDDVPSEAVTRTSPGRQDKAIEHARIAARIASENRARDIELLDLRKATPLVDFFVIATAPSRRQSNAIVSDIDAAMKKIGELKLGMEGSEEGRWVLIDYGDFVVHVLSPEARSYYALEDIWGDAPRLEWQDPAAPRPTAEGQDAEPADS